MEKAFNQKVNELLEKKCYVIDFLPQRVPTDSNGQYFRVENYLLNNFKKYGIYDKFVNVILKLMCYYHSMIQWNGVHDQPLPEITVSAVEEIMSNHSGTLNILFPDENVLLVFEWDCLNLSVYNPNEDVQRLMMSIVQSEGLFLWEAEMQNLQETNIRE